MKHVPAPAPAAAPLKTADQVLAEFKQAGVSIGGWARRHGYSRMVAYGVLNGTAKGAYGQAHEIAVALGLKAGRIVDPVSFNAPKREAA